MMAGNDSELLRLLQLLKGELPQEQAEDWRSRLASDPRLRAEYAALERVWRELGDDPEVLPRPGFATSVVARARAEGAPGASLSWSLAPAWAKAAAVLALVAGAAIGSSLMMLGGDQRAAPIAATTLETTTESASLTLADDYAAALQSPDAGADSAQNEVRQ
jgi:anti-sigma factor RsiW